MNKLCYLIIFVAFLTFICSCNKKCEDEEGKLTVEELSWIPYSGGETLIFKGNNNQTDTLKVDDNVIYNTPVTGMNSSSCEPKQQSMICKISGSMRAMDISTNHKNEWSPDGKPYILTSVAVFNFMDYNPQSNILINGITYNDVYIMNVDTSLFTNKNIWRIYYTKQNGILRYDLTHGEQWEKIN
jgi:hypothetical protein